MKVTVRYFAVLREQRGLEVESIESLSETLGELYAELRSKHGFTLSDSQVRFAVDNDFMSPDARMKDGDEIVLIPPVAGG